MLLIKRSSCLLVMSCTLLFLKWNYVNLLFYLAGIKSQHRFFLLLLLFLLIHLNANNINTLNHFWPNMSQSVKNTNTLFVITSICVIQYSLFHYLILSKYLLFIFSYFSPLFHLSHIYFSLIFFQIFVFQILEFKIFLYIIF